MRSWIPLLACLILLACQQKPVFPGTPVTRQEEGEVHTLLGSRTTATIGGATSIIGYRIVSPLARDFETLKRTHPLAGGYPVLEQVPVPLPAGREIAAILLNPQTYDQKYQTSCNFDPGYLLTFRRGADSVDVVLCFHCGDLEIVPSNSLREAGTGQPFGQASAKLYRIVTKVILTRQPPA